MHSHSKSRRTICNVQNANSEQEGGKLPQDHCNSPLLGLHERVCYSRRPSALRCYEIDFHPFGDCGRRLFLALCGRSSSHGSTSYGSREASTAAARTSASSSEYRPATCPTTQRRSTLINFQLGTDPGFAWNY